MSVTVLVTGGSGLVGCAIAEFIKNDPVSAGESWIFVGSKDANLMYTILLFYFINFIIVIDCYSQEPR